MTPGLLIAFATVLIASIGFVFEVGRRIGRRQREHTNVTADVDELSEQVAEQHASLQERLDSEAHLRERERKVVLDWLEGLTDSLIEEGYDVDRPEAVQQNINLAWESEETGQHRRQKENN